MDPALSCLSAEALLVWAQEQKNEGRFQAAEMGRGSERRLDPKTRGDSIFWLEPEDHPSLFAALETFQQILNRELYLGLQNFECHLAHYPSGTRYDKHLDQHPGPSAAATALTGQRAVSFVLYLNKSWTPGDGGELKLYLPTTELIEPHLGRMVVFLSDKIWHEVLLSNKDRWSLTGWFRQRRL